MTVWEANVLSVQLMIAEEYYVKFEVHALKDEMDLAIHMSVFLPNTQTMQD